MFVVSEGNCKRQCAAIAGRWHLKPAAAWFAVVFRNLAACLLAVVTASQPCAAITSRLSIQEPPMHITLGRFGAVSSVTPPVAESQLRQRRSQRFQISRPTGGLGREELCKLIAARNECHGLGRTGYSRQKWHAQGALGCDFGAGIEKPGRSSDAHRMVSLIVARGSTRASRHRENDLAHVLTALHMTMRIGNAFERKSSVDDGSESPFSEEWHGIRFYRVGKTRLIFDRSRP
jgi:hypothetical protein